MPVDLTKPNDRRMVAALSFLTRAGIGYVGMRNDLKVETLNTVEQLYPTITDAEAFVLLAIRFAEAESGSFGDFILEITQDAPWVMG